MMKKVSLFLLLFPIITIAQNKKKSTGKSPASNVEAKLASSNASKGYSINGTIEGYPDGTVVDLLNGNNRMPETTTKLINGKFLLNGKVEAPDFKLITFDKSQSYILLFLDNSDITISAKKDELNKAIVTGSKTQDDFMVYSRITTPFEPMFQQGAVIDKEAAKQCIYQLINFVENNKSSFISPLAIYRINQLNSDVDMMEELYSKLSEEVKVSPIGSYIAQQINDSKKDPLGRVIPDFEQADVNGTKVNIKSFRGQYVLIDFWASWCGPCRGENPNVVNAFNKYKDKGFTVLGISLDKTKDPWIEAISHDGLTWTHVSDLRGWSNAVAQQFGIQSIPQNFLVDPSGVVIGKNLRGAALEAKLESIFKK